MSVVVVFDTKTNRILQHIEAAHTPDYSSRADALIDPDLKPVETIPIRYWKHVSGTVAEMTRDEKLVIDQEEKAARQTGTDQTLAIDVTPFLSPEIMATLLNLVPPVTSDQVQSSIKGQIYDPTIRLGLAQLASPGTGDASVEFATGKSPVSSLQFDFSVPAGFTVTAVVAGPVALAANKSVSFSQLSPGVYRILVAGLNQTAIQAGVIAITTFSAGSGIEAGDYTVSAVGAVMSDPDAITVQSVIHSGTLRVA